MSDFNWGLCSLKIAFDDLSITISFCKNSFAVFELKSCVKKRLHFDF